MQVAVVVQLYHRSCYSLLFFLLMQFLDFYDQNPFAPFHVHSLLKLASLFSNGQRRSMLRLVELLLLDQHYQWSFLSLHHPALRFYDL